MIFKHPSRYSVYVRIFFSCLAMSIFFTVFVTVIFLNSSLQPQIAADANDEDLIEEFRDLFSEFMRDPGHSSKRIRDISGNKRSESPKTKSSEQNRSSKTADERTTDRSKLQPLYPCNHFDASARSCVNVRQLGTTLTIGIRVENRERNDYPIHWYRFFKLRGQDEDKSLKFVKLTKGNLPWNINIGGENSELRISPITEVDFSYNFFLATLEEGNPEDIQKKSKKHLQLLKFIIEPISIDMGPLYHGEEITVNVRSFMELPARSVRYEWATVGRNFEVGRALPSNMKLGRDGSSLVIKEHRNYGDLLLTCAVFSNKDYHLARRNFYLRRIDLEPSQNVKIGAGPSFVRKRRNLDDFYTEPMKETYLFPKPKRSNMRSSREVPLDVNRFLEADDRNDPGGTIDPTGDPLNYFSEIDSDFSSTVGNQFDVVDKSQDAEMLNFYANPPPAMGIASQADEVPPQMTNPKSQSLDRLIGQANDIVQSGGRENPTTRISVEEILTPEDKESMMIADCLEDADCGINAVCFRIDRNQRFCRCKQRYRGNGLFCWLF